MKYVLLFCLAILLSACESAQNFKRPESSQQCCDMCGADDADSPVFED